MTNTTRTQTKSTSSKPRALRLFLAAPAAAIAIAIAPAPLQSHEDAAVAALSKRFMRFNEYLFNGVQHGTAIAAIRSTAHESHV